MASTHPDDTASRPDTALAALIGILADGRFHSGNALAAALGLSRTAVWQRIRRLRTALGLDIAAVPGRGYRLQSPLELLDAARIRAAMSPRWREAVAIHTHISLDSTNRHLLEAAATGAPAGTVCFAEHQSAGRGRRGRHWVSPLGRNLYFSLLWPMPTGPGNPAGLSLAVGVALAEGLSAWLEDGRGDVRVGKDGGLALKWPNDLYWSGRKLGGILLEMRGEVGENGSVVVGIGLNLAMSEALGVEAIDQAWTDLQTACGRRVDRNALAGVLLSSVMAALARYDEGGLAPFLPTWQRFDAFRDRPVVLRGVAGTIEGVARGIDASGALLVETGGRVARFYSGELSLRGKDLA